MMEWFLEKQPEFVEKFTPDTAHRHDQLEMLCTTMRFRQFLPGQVILRQGELGKEFFIILAGTCTVHFQPDPTTAKDDLGNVVSRLGVGDSFGELAITMANQRRSASFLER